jgi:hypothetical protein
MLFAVIFTDKPGHGALRAEQRARRRIIIRHEVIP